MGELTKDQLLAWAAGFIDGEGSIGLKSSGGKVSLCIQVTQVDPVPLLRLRELWGGALRFRSRRSIERADYYHWFIWSSAASRCCADILPYLTVKRAQAEVAIQFAAEVHNSRGGLSPDKRQEYRALFSALNRRGVSKPRTDEVPNTAPNLYLVAAEEAV